MQGAVSNPGDYLQTAFCYLSTSRWEGMPMAVLEAMAAGLPVVATDVVGNNDVVVHGKMGFLYDEHKADAAARHIIALADDADLWLRLSQASRTQTCERFGAERMAEETAALYADALQNRLRAAK